MVSINTLCPSVHCFYSITSHGSCDVIKVSSHQFNSVLFIWRFIQSELSQGSLQRPRIWKPSSIRNDQGLDCRPGGRERERERKFWGRMQTQLMTWIIGMYQAASNQWWKLCFQEVAEWHGRSRCFTAAQRAYILCQNQIRQKSSISISPLITARM